MSRLPDEFVKAPVTPKRSTKRRAAPVADKKVARTALALTGEVVVTLGDDERRALGAALDELKRNGEELTIEQMVGRVIHDWVSARTAPPPPALTVELAIAQVMKMVRSPVRTWRELGGSLRRAVAAL